MRLKDFRIFWLFLLTGLQAAMAQFEVSGKVSRDTDGLPLAGIEIYDKEKGLVATSDAEGNFRFSTKKETLTLIYFSYEYELKEQDLSLSEYNGVKVVLKEITVNLTEVEVTARRQKVFELSRLKDVEETAIYAGKKTEVVLVEQSMANLASNNARQIFARVAGLNIYQNDDAGLQLNVGGRGLDPNRTSNFNTRQNGYDISADVLGYPESYYTPAAEGLSEIQVIRGAASLQYGSQFGGLINFKMKEPPRDKAFELLTRNTLGSYGLYTNFTSIGGTTGKLGYYGFFNYKKGDGFRPNSEFESKNTYVFLGYEPDEKSKLSAELTYMRYLAQQAGGLTDRMFELDPYQSNRARNWFQVDWLLYNLKYTRQFSEQTNFSLSFFGLNASRKALGFRTNRVDQVDPGTERDLIVGDFSNFGLEGRLLHGYQLASQESKLLLGAKFYKANNFQQQGAGSSGIGPDFEFANEDYPNYPNQSRFDLPNLNLAFFGENVLYLGDSFSVTPGFRLEYIKTQSEGSYKRINTDAAGNVILEEEVEDNREYDRSFVLLGLGLSYKPAEGVEVYGNISQNYRSVTFSDINVSNPAFAIDPDITDENGYSADLGLRGRWGRLLSYDVGAFGLFYNDRIGFVQKVLPDGRIISERTNVGDARMYGLETLLDFNILGLIDSGPDWVLNVFANTAWINSEYTKSLQPGITGNEVEFVPDINFKTGLKAGYRNLLASLQYTYMGSQFTDATNSTEANLSGVIGAIPAYDILDVSASYTHRRWKFEAGVNNLLNEAYFTRRATGYPGPGIIPSAPRNWYAGVQIRL